MNSTLRFAFSRRAVLSANKFAMKGDERMMILNIRTLSTSATSQTKLPAPFGRKSTVLLKRGSINRQKSVLAYDVDQTVKDDLTSPPQVHQEQYPLLPIQEKAIKWLPYIEKFCQLSAVALGTSKPLAPRENTRRCYEHFFDPLCAETNVWPDYTEGYYANGTESYEEAKIKQFDFILDQTGVDKNTKLIEIGCGNGRLLERAKDQKGCVDRRGITLSRTQAKTCEDMGLTVDVMNFFDSQDNYERGSFDVVIMNGPTEHFVTEEDVVSGRKDEIHDKIFEVASSLLKPGGRLFITCIHFNRPDTSIKEVMKPALQHDVGSYNFHCSVLVGLYSGWYPDVGNYETAATKNGLHKTFERDATNDYITSRLWGRKLRSFLKAKENKKFRNRFLLDLFLKDPNYFFTTGLFMFYDSWTWQFRPENNNETPMIHRWLMFEKEE